MADLENATATKGKEVKKHTMFRAFLDDFEVQQFDLSENSKEELESHRWTIYSLFCIDTMLCFTIIGPLVVAFWRGTWGMYDHLLDEVIFQGKYTLSYCYALLLGTLFCLLLDVFHPSLRSWAGGEGTVRHAVLRHMFSVSWAAVDILFWKGIWDQIDHQAGYGPSQAMCTTSLGLAILLPLGRFKSAMSMPVGIVVDQEEDQINCSTFLESGPKDSMARRLLDGAATRLVEAGVVLVWHGVWSALDVLAEDPRLGFGLSHGDGAMAFLLAGWASAPLILMLNPPLLAAKLTLGLQSNILRLLLLLFNMLSTVVTIACFRGIWYLMDVHFLLGDTDDVTLLSKFLGWLLGLLGLIAFRCTSCLHAGAYSDLPEEGVTITFHLTSFFYIRSWETQQTSGLKS